MYGFTLAVGWKLRPEFAAVVCWVRGVSAEWRLEMGLPWLKGKDLTVCTWGRLFRSVRGFHYFLLGWLFFQRSEAGKQPSILWRVIYISVQSFLLRARGQNLPNSTSVKHLPQLWAFSFSPLRDWALLPLPVLLPKWPRGHGLDNPILFTPKASQSGASQTHLHTCSPCCLGLTNDTGLVLLVWSWGKQLCGHQELQEGRGQAYPPWESFPGCHQSPSKLGSQKEGDI